MTNQINQLPDTARGQPSLKDLLAQLQTAINQDTELSTDEKAEALGEVEKLAKAGTPIPRRVKCRVWQSGQPQR